MNYNNNSSSSNTTQIATLANGCFWCSEAIFKRLKGVKSVLPGYSGGIVENPSYEQVWTGMYRKHRTCRVDSDRICLLSKQKVVNPGWALWSSARPVKTVI
jgi:peptide-methionine (S)-S-oxide reductase